MNTQTYFENLKKEVDRIYAVASEARSKGYDPKSVVEIPLAMSMAEKVVGLISTIYPQMMKSGIAERILELEKTYGKLDTTVVFKIAEEVARQKFCTFKDLLESMDAGIRVGFAYATLGVVSSPIEGYTGLKVRKTREGKEYIEASFSGPIRSAGTTASCVVLILIDYLREMFGFSKYDPTEDEIKRVFSELEHFHERVANLQYMPTEAEALFLARNLPIQIAGEASEKIEVPNYKNLERVDTNYLRSGFCLVIGEGLAQKAAKGLRLLNGAKKNGIISTGFDFLGEYVKLHEKRDKGKVDDSPTYIKDLVAGRPIFGHPSKSGGFRFRYGRGRVSGFSAASFHPATMEITDEFIAIGTQLKIEKPTKGCCATVCDSIDGPIVRLFNGSVKKLNSREEAKSLYSDVDEIIYLGDMLFPFSDLANRNATLVKPGYVEEWWVLDLREKDESFKGMNYFSVSLEKAIELSEKYKIPLHPKYIPYWTQTTNEGLKDLIDWLENSRVDKKIILPFNKLDREKFKLGKRGLELLGIEHQVTIENVVINEENSKALLINLGIDMSILDEQRNLKGIFEGKIIDKEKSVLENINSFSKYEIKDKAGEFIGTRMGRPEKAKLRKLIGSPNVLFPVGKEGGRLRSVQAAVMEGKVWSSFPLYYCENCKKETIYPACENCNNKTKEMYYFRESKEKFFDKNDIASNKEGVQYFNQSLDIKHYYEESIRKLGLTKEEIPLLIKGVRGTSSANHAIENLSKGILRAKYDLQVNKDGTIRFDATELPLIHFKPKEVYVSVNKLRELGYTQDYIGEELVNDDQILELMPHDVLLPSSFDSLDEKADDVFFKVSKFVDDELEKFYGMERLYNVGKKEDIIGQLGVCMAPHNCAGVVCRFVGFSNTQGLFASPYMHAAVRRDCFDYETYIPIKKDGFWRNVKIGELIEGLNPEKEADNFGTKEKKVEGFETISFEKKLGEFKINNFTKHSKMKMFEIKTALGKSLKVTENHKFFVGGKEKRMNNLNIGDKLPLPKRINIQSQDLKEINLIDFLKDENLMVRKINHILNGVNIRDILRKLVISTKQFSNFKLRDSYPIKFVLELDKGTLKKVLKEGKLATKRDNVEVPIVINLTKELLEVIGLYIAEGYSRSINSKKGLNQVYIASNDKILRLFVEKVIKNSFGLVKTENKKDRVTFSSKVLYLFFTKILETGSVARDKRIPYLFLNLPLNRLACVLRGYFEGDGSVSQSDIRVSCDTVSEGLLSDLEFCLARFGIFAKRYEYEKEPGPVVKKFYVLKNIIVPKFKITKLIIGSDFIKEFNQIGFLSLRKNKILKEYSKRNPSGMRIDHDSNFIYDPIVSIKYIGEKESYCLNVNTKSHLVMGNSIISAQCDGDEAAIMLLGDVLLNFSREFLPSHRGGTQDAPLVLNAKIDAGEVDDQILDFEFLMEYPLELYRTAEKGKHSSEIKVNTVRDILKRGEDPFVGAGFTHNTDNFNDGVLCSSYKRLLTMKDKVRHQMELVEKLRSVDTSDTARLIIDRHFIRDMRGNLRKFSMQEFRCVSCNEIVRRTPLNGVCPKCGGKLIFTIHEGGIKKYLEPALDLAKKYNLSKYMQQNLELVKRYVDSIFGRELEKQEALAKWF
jgi:DNA polymerase II large subunit